jgi:hypothetical protein
MTKLVKLSDHSDNAKTFSVEDTLETALRDLRDGTRVANKIAVVFLDDSGGNYRVGFQQAGFHMSELVALLAVLQHSIIGEEMGFNEVRK